MDYGIRNVHVMAVCHVCHVKSNVIINGSQSCIVNVKYILSSLYKQQLILMYIIYKYSLFSVLL